MLRSLKMLQQKLLQKFPVDPLISKKMNNALHSCCTGQPYDMSCVASPVTSCFSSAVRWAWRDVRPLCEQHRGPPVGGGGAT